jgi:hypothetical protein
LPKFFSGFFRSGVSTKALCAFFFSHMCVICRTHLIPGICSPIIFGENCEIYLIFVFF